ncbi:MAG: ATP-binding protein, partial [Nocardiopsis sp. BM-2018]
MISLRFSAVVGQHDAKRALVLAAIRPSLGGVLLRGDKGSAKTTLARGLAALLPGDAPFVEVPLGAGEDRVIGSLDLASVLAAGEAAFRPGLLEAAHGGVLYIDEVNLLADHLVDALLDVAATGWNQVERDGVSHRHPARFVMVASMNPEEGELRPQLLDRFGLSVEVSAPTDVDERVEAVRRQLRADAVGSGHEAAHEDPDRSGEAADRDLREQIEVARAATPRIGTDVMESASRLALAVGAEGLRADLMLCRAAAALAALESRPVVTPDDVRSVAAMVLGHRRRRTPFEQPGIDDTELDRAWDQSHREPPPTGSESSDDGAGPATAGEPGGDEPLGDESTAPPDGGGPDRVDLPGTASAQFDLGRPRTRL